MHYTTGKDTWYFLTLNQLLKTFSLPFEQIQQAPARKLPPEPVWWLYREHSVALFCVQKTIWTGPTSTPLSNILSRISASLGLAVSWLRFCPVESCLPDHSTSPAALARGHTMSSKFTGSVCSDHICTSPPRTRCVELAGTPARGS
jgi:hypothetical protein